MQAERPGIPPTGSRGAALAGIRTASGTDALPLQPEYRTLPMVWYIPPLSPVTDVIHAAGYDLATRPGLRHHLALRIPVEYLANLFTAAGPIRCAVLRKLAAVRA